MEYAQLKEIGKRIAIRRKQLDYTQEQLAEMMEVSIQMVSNLERGVKAIRIDNLINLSRILQVSTDFILTGRSASQEDAVLADKISQLSPENQKMIELLVNYCSDPKAYQSMK